MTNNYPSALGSKAYPGQLKYILDAVLPYTEADEVAILSQLLVGYGNVIGRSPYFEVEATRHGTNLFALNIGISAKGRKGTSWSRVRDLLSSSDCDWLSNNILSGLSSGEGLMWRLIDKATNSQGDQLEFSENKDKRLLCLESEFASVLKVASRDGNTLSPIIRNAWDGSKLSSLTKNSPMTVTDPHISIIGHITPSELIRYLNQTEMCNGLGNRFLYFCVKRSKLLPDGGDMREESRADCIEYIKTATEFAKKIERVTKTNAAKNYWREIYADLSGERWGITGHLLSRAEATVMRLSLIIALFNLRDQIDVVDLDAALEYWRYNEESVKYIFGHSLGNPVADEILSELEYTRCMTRTDIRNLFHKNRSATTIENAIRELENSNLITRSKKKTGGRSTEIISLSGQVTTETTNAIEEQNAGDHLSYMSFLS